MKKRLYVYQSSNTHWVGDGFPARSVFDYYGLGKDLSPFLLLDYVAPYRFSPTNQRRGVGAHPHKGFETMTMTGLLAGLRDVQLAAALRGIHTQTAHPWTLVTLARAAGMSRSSFAERFARVIGMTPLNYLLQWRIAVAKSMLAHEQKSVAETAFAVGYESASGCSTAFSRETGRSPKEFIGADRAAE